MILESDFDVVVTIREMAQEIEALKREVEALKRASPAPPAVPAKKLDGKKQSEFLS